MFHYKIASKPLKNPMYQPIRLVNKPRILTINKNNISDIEAVSYVVGKSIMLFTMFYCGLNYFFYKKMREDNEDK